MSLARRQYGFEPISAIELYALIVEARELAPEAFAELEGLHAFAGRLFDAEATAGYAELAELHGELLVRLVILAMRLEETPGGQKRARTRERAYPVS